MLHLPQHHLGCLLKDGHCYPRPSRVKEVKDNDRAPHNTSNYYKTIHQNAREHIPQDPDVHMMTHIDSDDLVWAAPCPQGHNILKQLS